MPTDGYSLVLVVEPEENSLAEMVRALRAAGYHTAGASTFEEARRQIRLDPPRIVIARARLGAYSGIHVALLARGARPDCQTLIFTDEPDPVLEREVGDAGAVFTIKPIASDMLAAVAALFGAAPCNADPPSELASLAERRMEERRKAVTPDFAPERRVAERRRIDQSPDKLGFTRDRCL